MTIKAVATAANVSSAPAIGSYTIYAGADANSLTAIDLSKGFSPNQDFALNGSARISGSRLRLTDGNRSEAGNAFYTAGTVDSTKPFIASFTFQLSSPNPSVPLSDIADGITFLMTTDYQANFLHWLGGDGSSLGYGNLPAPSYSLKFDLHNDIGEGNNSTGLCADNSSATYCSVNLNGSGLDLHSGNPIFAQVSYDGLISPLPSSIRRLSLAGPTSSRPTSLRIFSRAQFTLDSAVAREAKLQCRTYSTGLSSELATCYPHPWPFPRIQLFRAASIHLV